MPQYYSVPAWMGRGKVTVTPKSIWRKLPILKWIPYFVGDRIEFIVHIDKPKGNELKGSCSVWETFGSQYKLLTDINKSDTEVIGTRISSAGNIEYRIGFRDPTQSSETIITAVAQNWDTVIVKWVWIIVGIVLGAVSTKIIEDCF
jgi:hypothetical protein